MSHMFSLNLMVQRRAFSTLDQGAAVKGQKAASLCDVTLRSDSGTLSDPEHLANGTTVSVTIFLPLT